MNSRDPVSDSPVGLQVYTSLAFSMGSGDPNSGPYYYKADTDWATFTVLNLTKKFNTFKADYNIFNHFFTLKDTLDQVN